MSAHVLKMKYYIDHLKQLGFPISQELIIDLILNSLPDSYDQFIMNYNMNDMDKLISELHAMLKTAKQNIKKKPGNILMIQKGKGMKKKGQGNAMAMKSSRPKPKPKPKPKAKPPKEGVCFHCNESGHWKRNYKSYLEDLKKKKSSHTTTSGIYIIEINLSTSTSWALDTGCRPHICTSVQGLNRSRYVKKGQVDLRVGNGAKVAALIVGTYELILPDGLLLMLNNCYYVPSLSRNIISISCLDNEGFSFIIKNNKGSIYNKDMFYTNADLHDGLYVLNLKHES